MKAKKKTFNDYIVPLEHNGKQVTETEYMTDALSREGARFVHEAAAKDEPFFLYLAYNAPHTPLQAKEEDIALYANIKDEKRRTYAAMVHAVDRGVGKVVNALKQSNEFDNTLIVFLSDNGGKLGAGADNSPLRQGKGSVCEGGFRVPMFFHWPNQIPAAKRYPHPVTALDFYPTFAGLAGADIPDTQKLDGKNIWNDFIAGRNPRKDETIFAMRFHAAFGNVGVRQDQWKALCLGKNWSLYNIEEDIGETTDVSEQHPDVLKSLISATKAWSQTHTQPEWFDNPAAGKRWVENGMPNYDFIFPSQ